MIGIFLDIETTGLDSTRHAAIDLAFTMVDLRNGQVIDSYQSLIALPDEIWAKKDPVSMEINGYTWDQVKTGKLLSQVCEEVLQKFKNAGIQRGSAVFICQNPAFDRGFFAQIVDVYTQEKLNWPYHWLDFASMYWALLCRSVKEGNDSFPQSINLSKNSIGKLFSIPPEEVPHLAKNGVDHLINCYRRVVGFPESA
ncbi:MAG: 3'-5' exonuclease [Parachlamydiaceae bacterium]